MAAIFFSFKEAHDGFQHFPALIIWWVSTTKNLSVGAAIIKSNKYPTIAEQVVFIFITSLVTIATVKSVKDTIYFRLKCLWNEN